MSNSVSIDAYFERGYYDRNLIEFLSVKKRQDSKVYLFNGTDEKLVELYKICVQLHRECFNPVDLCQQQLRLINRIAETQGRWILYPLYFVCRQLTDVCINEEEDLEECGRLIHRSFSLCLNDRNPDKRDNRRDGSYYLATLEFKIYHKLGNREMIKNLIKVLESRNMTQIVLSRPLPLHSISVTYCYYLGEYYGCHQLDYQKGFKFLLQALLQCKMKYQRQVLQILTLLIPFGILANKWYPNRQVIQTKILVKNSDNVKFIDKYSTLVNCFITGNIREFENHLQTHEEFYLQKGLFISLLAIKELVFCQFIKNCHKILKADNKTIISLIPIAAAYQKLMASSIKLSNGKTKVKLPTKDAKQLTDFVTDELECKIANLIAKNYIKGYLSHSNRCLVLSKTDAFPPISRVPSNIT